MKNKANTEERFFIVFEDLIKTFAADRNLPTNENLGISKDFIIGFKDLSVQKQTSLETAASDSEIDMQTKRLNHQFEQFMLTLEKTTFDHYIIPYDKITESVFEHTPPEDLDKFTEDLFKRGTDYFSNKEVSTGEYVVQGNTHPAENAVLDLEKMYFKILRHINLALVQKYTLMRIQMKEIEALRREQRQLINRYETLKSEAETQSRSMLTQFITILGIFAAILMGAFGSIQGFANLFDNAHELDLGTLLIISSIGASSVLLILFFLLNGIAKLTGKNLSSTNKKDGTLLEKHPSLTILHGILILISLVGASIKLSNITIQFSWSGLWWLLPILWMLYIVIALSTKKLIPSFTHYVNDSGQASIKPISEEIKELITKKELD